MVNITTNSTIIIIMLLHCVTNSDNDDAII